MALQIFCFCTIDCPSGARSERGIWKVYRAPPEGAQSTWGDGEGMALRSSRRRTDRTKPRNNFLSRNVTRPEHEDVCGGGGGVRNDVVPRGKSGQKWSPNFVVVNFVV